MVSSFSSKLKLFFYLLKIDLTILLARIGSDIFDNLVWISLSIFVNGCVLPKLGISTAFGGFVCSGHITTLAIFSVYHAAMILVSDFKNNKTINFELMLPLPSWAVFLKTAISWGVRPFILGLFAIPVGKLLLGAELPLEDFSIFKFLTAVLVINFFSGCFAIFVTSLMRDILSISLVWARVLNPMWFLGGAFFNYATMYKHYPVFAKVLLLNPVTYAMELSRGAVLGQDKVFLNFYVCVFALITASCVFFSIGYLRLKNKLQFV